MLEMPGDDGLGREATPRSGRRGVHLLRPRRTRAPIRMPPESEAAKHGDDGARKQLLDELTARARSAHLRDINLALRSGAVTWTLAGVGFDPSETALARDAAAAVAEVAGVLKAQG